MAGIGTPPFGKYFDRDLGSLAQEAVSEALVDSGFGPEAIQYVVFSNAAAGVLSGQEMIRGQVSLKGTGLAGVPIVNTENACASGSTAAHLAWLAVASGQVDVAMAVGAEKLFHEDKQRSFAAIESGTDLSLSEQGEDVTGGSVMMASYAKEARRYSDRNGDVNAALTAVAVKNRRYAADNPSAQFRTPITAADVEASRPVADPLRLLTCSPLTDGAAAIVFRAAGAASFGHRSPVTVRFSNMVSYKPGTSAVERAAKRAYSATGLTPNEIDVFQLHDACAFAEVVQYEQVGIALPGEGAEAVLSGRTGPGGDSPVNSDGGLLSRGHALGATGLSQLSELVRQLRGDAGPRQVTNPRYALAVNSGGWMGDDYATSVATVLSAA